MGGGAAPSPASPQPTDRTECISPPKTPSTPNLPVLRFHPRTQGSCWGCWGHPAPRPPGSPAPDVVQEGVLGLHGEGQQCHLPGQGAEWGQQPCPPRVPSPRPPVLTVPEFRYFFFFIFFLGFTTWGGGWELLPMGHPGVQRGTLGGGTPRGAAQGTVAPRGAGQGHPEAPWGPRHPWVQCGDPGTQDRDTLAVQCGDLGTVMLRGVAQGL